MTYPVVKHLSPWRRGCIKDAEVWNCPPGAACAGDRDSSTPVPSQAGWGQPCLEGLSLKFFLLLRHRAHFRLPCEGFWADLPPEERVFGCGCAAAPGSLAPVAPDWLQPSTPGSIPSPLLLITKLFTCLPRNISWSCRSLHLCSPPPPSPGCVWS